jgi:hypothetical protein
MVFYLAGSVNPNGVEIAAAIALWATLLALLRAPVTPLAEGRLVARAGVALVVLALTRGLSPVYGALAVAAAAALAPPGRLRALARRSDVRAWGVAALAACLSTAAWLVVVARPHQIPRPGTGLSHAIGRTGEVLRQSVGSIGIFFTSVPAAVYVVWAIVTAALLVLAAVTATRRDALALLGVVLLALVLPVSAEGLAFPRVGFEWQGRYGLPVTVGVAVAAGAVATLRRARLPSGRGLAVSFPAVLLLAAMQVVAFVGVARDLSEGRGLDAVLFSQEPRVAWDPPAPVALLTAVVVVGLFASALLARAPAPTRRYPEALVGTSSKRN